MRDRRHIRRGLSVLLPSLLVGVAAPAPAHAAGGLFDAIGSLFRGSPEPPRYDRPAPYGYDLDDGGLAVTVRARRKPRRERPVARRPLPAKPPAELNPAKNANWHLEDPTLRRGDIVVLKGEVLVFQGGRAPFSRDDFTSLDKSKLSKAERERIAAMAALPNRRVTETGIVRPRTASAPQADSAARGEDRPVR